MGCFVAEFIIGPAEGGTRWPLAMMAVSTPISLLLLRPVIGDAPDDSGIAEFPAQIVDRAFGVRRAAVEHVGVVGLRSRTQGADAGAHQPESGAVDLLCQHFAANSEDLRRQLCRGVNRLRAGAL